MGRVVVCDIAPLWAYAIDQEKKNKIIGLSLIMVAASSIMLCDKVVKLEREVRKLKEANKCNA